MTILTRRTALQLAAGAAALPAANPLANFPGLAPMGRVRPRSSRSILASPLSVGFEMLDRKLFDPRRAIPHLAELGVKWARTQTGWSLCEQVKGEYSFGWLDEVVDGLLAAGIQPWFNLGFGNRLYTPEAAHQTAVGFPPLNSPEAREAWVRFTGKIAEHFARRVRHWEIWNEPNISAFWRPKTPNPDDYMELVRMTAPEIRKRVPNAVIVGGGFSGVPLDYLERCLDLDMARYVDRVSYHPYRRVPEADYDTDVRAMHALLGHYRPRLPIWQGENGIRSALTIYGLEWDEAMQAKWLLRRTLSDLNLDVELSSYFHTVDCLNYFIWSQQESSRQMRAGLLRADYTPKPSYHAYQSLCALFDAETARADLLVNFRGGVDIPAIRAASWLRRGYPLYAYWYPTDFAQPFAPRRISLTLWSGRRAPLRQPVLVDPLTGAVYRLESAQQKKQHWHVAAVPLLDSPLIVTDSAAAGYAREAIASPVNGAGNPLGSGELPRSRNMAPIHYDLP